MIGRSGGSGTPDAGRQQRSLADGGTGQGGLWRRRYHRPVYGQPQYRYPGCRRAGTVHASPFETVSKLDCYMTHKSHEGAVRGNVDSKHKERKRPRLFRGRFLVCGQFPFFSKLCYTNLYILRYLSFAQECANRDIGEDAVYELDQFTEFTIYHSAVDHFGKGQIYRGRRGALCSPDRISGG